MELFELDNFFSYLNDVLTEGKEDNRQDILRMCRHALSLGFELAIEDAYICITLPNDAKCEFLVNYEVTSKDIPPSTLRRLRAYIREIERALGPKIYENLTNIAEAKTKINKWLQKNNE